MTVISHHKSSLLLPESSSPCAAEIARVLKMFQLSSLISSFALEARRATRNSRETDDLHASRGDPADPGDQWLRSAPELLASHLWVQGTDAQYHKIIECFYDASLGSNTRTERRGAKRICSANA